MPDLLTTAEAAALLSLTDYRIRQLIRSGSLPARRLGRDWLIDREALLALTRRPRGWPKGISRKARPPGF